MIKMMVMMMKMTTMTEMLMLVVVLHLSSLTCADAVNPLYSLSAPSEYVLFMGPLKFAYRIPANVSLPNAFVKLESQGQGTHTSKSITAVGLTKGKREDILSVACGHLDFAADYTLTMFTWVNGQILTQTKVKVVWPKILMSLPDNHEVQTINTNLHVLSPPTKCYSHLHTMQIKLIFQRTVVSNHNQSQVLDLSPNAEIIHQLNFSSSLLLEDFRDETLPCHLFDLDGFYQAVMVSSAVGSQPVARSNVMAVKWSKQYSLKHSSNSLFPCIDHVTVTYIHPACSTVDKIRVYSLHRMAEGSLASPLKRKFLAEQDTSANANRMTFPCQIFNPFNQSAAGFLFIYVSVTRRHTYYTDQSRLTISAWPDSDFPLDGAWGQWSAWSSCSVSCGIGKKNRVRMCDSPAPKHGGMYCDGKPFQWSPCSADCPDVDHNTVSPLQSVPLDPACVCGCTKEDKEGEIIATDTCNETAVWYIRTRKEWVVSLTFGYFSLDNSRQVVLVRDGVAVSDDLIFSSLDVGYPLEIVTTGPVLRLEMKMLNLRPRPSSLHDNMNAHLVDEGTLPLHRKGFVARYKSLANMTGIPSPVLYPYHDDKTVMGSTITIIGIILCVVIILATVIFVILQRVYLQKRVKYRSAPVGGSPSHGVPMKTHSDSHLSKHQQQQQQLSHLTTSQISSSNASSPDAGTILVDMERPLTGKHHHSKNKFLKPESGGISGIGNTGKEETRHSKKHREHSSKSKSKSSSVSSACISNNKNKMKLFQPSTSSDASSSPKPSSREYASVKSGCEIDSIEEVEHGKDATTTTSKHAHFKPKPSPLSPSPIISKFEILKNKSKRKKSTSESSDTSASQKSRSAVSTTKAEVNWPQSNFVKTAWNEMGKPFYDRHRPGQRPPSEEIPLIDTSSQESPSHVNNLVKSESTDSAASAFVKTSNVRRPTSLTESYSSVQSKCDEQTITESPSDETEIEAGNEETVGIDADYGTLKKGDTTFRPRPTPSHTPSSSITPTSHILYKTSPYLPKVLSPSSNSALTVAGKLPSPSPSSSLPKTPTTPRATTTNTTKILSVRQTPNLLPPPSSSSSSSTSIRSPLKIDIPPDKKVSTTKDNNSPILYVTTKTSSISSIPDHQRKFSSSPNTNPNVQSPKLLRSNSQTPNPKRGGNSNSNNSAEAPSPSVLSKGSSMSSIRGGGSKTNVSSPTRSITTPSETEGLELEYDDFIEDDPLSYFDYEQTQKLAFRGSEKIGKSPIDEDDEEDASCHH